MSYIYVITREGDNQAVEAGERKWMVTNWLVAQNENPDVDLSEYWVTVLSPGRPELTKFYEAQDYLDRWVKEIEDRNEPCTS